MKSALLLLSLLFSTSAFANQKVLLSCTEKFNSLTVTADGDQLSITRSTFDRGLVYADRSDESDANLVVVRGYTTADNTALLADADATVNGNKVLITFKDKKKTKLEVVVGDVKEGQEVSFKSANSELVKGMLAALSADPAQGDLSFYRSETCQLNP
ncbi:MAG: hypothetical protein HUU57_04360 [Bdellovibrio sp.]|nr:hypothetical protein [Bdellovibrio sp.]